MCSRQVRAYIATREWKGKKEEGKKKILPAVSYYPNHMSLCFHNSLQPPFCVLQCPISVYYLVLSFDLTLKFHSDKMFRTWLMTSEPSTSTDPLNEERSFRLHEALTQAGVIRAQKQVGLGTDCCSSCLYIIMIKRYHYRG